MKFKIGDVVMLNSGGPHMTVNAIDLEGKNVVRCMWFVDPGEPRYGTFPNESVILCKILNPESGDRITLLKGSSFLAQTTT